MKIERTMEMPQLDEHEENKENATPLRYKRFGVDSFEKTRESNRGYTLTPIRLNRSRRVQLNELGRRASVADALHSGKMLLNSVLLQSLSIKWVPYPLIGLSSE